ncbi:MAG TPA: flagellar filament capping protein FliD [Candidatus Bathyarchaeia archaeon]|nr:flagellar filament capping protein FliD [Candidatus Bathyarchaeia archaeon]
MASGFSVGGLITGLDSNTIITQLMQIERQPITRIEGNKTALEKQKEAIKTLRTQLMTLRNRAQDFRLNLVFGKFKAATSEEDVMGVELSGAPVTGSYSIQVIQLASATVARSSAIMGQPIDANVSIDTSGITTTVNAGTFSINGVGFTVDPSTQSLSQILTEITNSAAGVNATYDPVTDRVTLENKTADDTSIINLGATGDTSNFLTAINIKSANQSTGATGATTVTSSVNLGAVNPALHLNEARFANGAVTAGTFLVNGIEITVDPATDSLSDVVQRITDSDAGVSASYDSATDTIQLVSKSLGSRTIALTAGTSNFLAITNLAAAVQTVGNDSQFSVNGGPVQTRNTNQVTDAIGGVTLRLLSAGATTVTVSSDDDSIVESVKTFLETLNESVTQIEGLVKTEGDLENDGTIQAIQMYMREIIFSQVSGISGSYMSLLDVGISTGSSFDSTATAKFELDEAKFKAALLEDRGNVKDLFNNTGGTGIADSLYAYLDETTRVNGFLNSRSKSNGSIDTQIRNLNDQIDRLEERVASKETRLRRQFSRLEQMSLTFQVQGASISSLSSMYSMF